MANPNPSPETRFKKGQAANPGGKTRAQRKAEIEAGRVAAQLRLDMLNALADLTRENQMALIEAIKADNLRLIKDSEDRAHGTPKQAVDHTSSDGSMKPVTHIEVIGVNADSTG